MVNKNNKDCDYYLFSYCRDRYLAHMCKLKQEPFDYGDCNEKCPLECKSEVGKVNILKNKL